VVPKSLKRFTTKGYYKETVLLYCCMEYSSLETKYGVPLLLSERKGNR